MIELSNVGMLYPLPKRYREFVTKPFSPRTVKRALENVSLTISKGERVAFLGPNGAGKTTLLKLISGLLLPTEGQIKVSGYDTLKDCEMVQKTVSLVLNEERSFYWRLTGRENLEFFGILQGKTGSILKQKMAEVIEVSALGDAIDRQVGSYSSGMRQRLALARGLIADPDVLILDEPTRALDPLAAAQMAEFLIETLHLRMNKSLLIATHRLEEAEFLCDRLLILAGGQLHRDENLSDVKNKYPSLLDFYTEGVQS